MFQPEPLTGLEPGLEPEMEASRGKKEPPRGSAQVMTGQRYPRHNFALVVLVSPGARGGPAIELTWKLASENADYLGHIPLQVSIYEKLVSALPGFCQEGTLTRLAVDANFRIEHARRLLDAMTDLKKAESLAEEAGG